MAIDLSAYSGKYPQSVLDAVQSYFTTKPDELAKFQGSDYNGNLDNYLRGIVGWWTQNGSQVKDMSGSQADTSLMNAMGYTQASNGNFQAGANAIGAGGTSVAAADPSNQFSVTSYLQQHPDIENNYITNPDLEKQYGSLSQYVLTVAGANGTDAEKSAINAGSFTADSTQSDANLLPALGYSQVGGQSSTAPIEQQMLNSILQNYITPDLNQDAANRTTAEGLVNDANANLTAYQGTNNSLIDGSRLTDEQKQASTTAANLAGSSTNMAIQQSGANNQENSTLSSALNQELGQQNSALTAETGQLNQALSTMSDAQKAALAPVLSARLASAQTEATGVNTGLQSTEDQLTAQKAAQGFVGGSSFDDANLARAVVGARQTAAQDVGAARTQNASDTNTLADALSQDQYNITGNDASSRFNIANTGAQTGYNNAGTFATQQFGIDNNYAQNLKTSADTGTNLDQTYFDNDLTRKLTAEQNNAIADQTKISNLTVPGSVGATGLTRDLGYLNWFAGGAAPTTTNPYTTQPNNTGSSLAALGSGLASAGVTAALKNTTPATPSAPTPMPQTPGVAANPGSITGGADTLNPDIGSLA